LVLTEYSVAAECEGLSLGASFICPAGRYCPEGVNISGLGQCPIGTFSNVSGLMHVSQCRPCVAGMYCGETGLLAPSGSCSTGYYCSSGSGAADASVCDRRSTICDSPRCQGLVPISSPEKCGGKCPAGSFCPSGSAHPILCPPGFFCDSTGRSNVSGPCSAGYYCDEYGITDAKYKECPIGFFCPTGSIFPTKCPLGTSGLYNRSASVDACVKCPAGYFCPDQGNLTGLQICPEGMYCPAGTLVPTYSCPRCYFCPPGSSWPSLCPAGQYQNVAGQGVCKVCPAGYVCGGFTNLTNLGNETFIDRTDGGAAECPPGFFCPENSTYANPCLKGTFSTQPGSANKSSCILCPPGQYCGSDGLSKPTGACFPGYFCAAGSKSGAERICPVGHYCPAGSYYPSICRAGTFARSVGSVNCTKVESGTYSLAEGLVEIKGATAFMICSNSTEFTACGMDANISVCPGPTKAIYGNCSEGYFCLAGSNTPTPLQSLVRDANFGNICPKGTFCPNASMVYTPCEPGTYQGTVGQSACLSVPEGFFTLDRSTIEPCPTGFYCFNRSKVAPRPCPRGTFNNVLGSTTPSACSICTEGMYCASPNLTKPSGLCYAGFLCSRGVEVPNPAGRLNATASQMGIGGGACPPGFYCPQGTVRMMPCPAGTYNNRSNAESLSFCKPCPAGRFCSFEGMGEFPLPSCSSGFYCPPPIKNISFLEVLSIAIDFDTIWTSVTNVSIVIGQTESAPSEFVCPQGFHCKEASIWPEPCCLQNGTDLYCVQGICYCSTYEAEWGSTGCKLCPPGQSCPAFSNATENPYSITTISCPMDHFCSEGQIPTLCPNGTFSNRNSSFLSLDDDCSPCPPGFWCTQGRIQGQCAAGYICSGGSRCPKPVNILVIPHASYSSYLLFPPPFLSSYLSIQHQPPPFSPSSSLSHHSFLNPTVCQPCFLPFVTKCRVVL
jgi:hypothetical protein